MLVCFTAISKAQQGRVGINTTTPATTLDVAADATNASKPDALLVPRLTRAQLLAKDNVYTAAQNGALAFITTIDGTATTKTANVTAVGFYYYDGQTTNTWIAVGGNVAPANPSWRDDSSAIVTILASDANNFVRSTSGSATAIILPAPTAAMKGKVFTIFETSGAAAPNFQTAGGVYKTTNVPQANPNGGYQFITDGTDWYNIGSN